MLATKPEIAGQAGNGVVNVVEAAGEVWLPAQLVVMVAVYSVPGIKPVRFTGEPVAACVWAVPPWGVYVTV